MRAWITSAWYHKHPLCMLLVPFSWVYQAIVLLRRLYFRCATKHSFSTPIIVVGNITLGGTGKTPFIMALCDFLTANGVKPGIISRGYGAKNQDYPKIVTPNSDAIDTGDEPLLLARCTGCPVVIDPNRVSAANLLTTEYEIDVIISDDGLQHYALPRDIEIVMVDAERLFGNGYCLPAGPLREPISRLQSVDYIVYNGKPPSRDAYSMQLIPHQLVHLQNQMTKTVSDFVGQTVHAVAGIGHPKRFFEMLKAHNINLIEHPFDDHHVFCQKQLQFEDNLPILMTPKDAVKCREFTSLDIWVVEPKIEVEDKLLHAILKDLHEQKTA